MRLAPLLTLFFSLLCSTLASAAGEAPPPAWLFPSSNVRWTSWTDKTKDKKGRKAIVALWAYQKGARWFANLNGDLDPIPELNIAMSELGDILASPDGKWLAVESGAEGVRSLEIFSLPQVIEGKATKAVWTSPTSTPADQDDCVGSPERWMGDRLIFKHPMTKKSFAVNPSIGKCEKLKR